MRFYGRQRRSVWGSLDLATTTSVIDGDPHCVIEARSLRKTYGKTVAADGVTFEVREGEIFGLLGPNGGEDSDARIR